MLRRPVAESHISRGGGGGGALLATLIGPLCKTSLAGDAYCWVAGWVGSRVCDVLCFCHFPMRCPGSGVVPDCIDS